MSGLEESPYATLEVPRTATASQIEGAYLRLKGLLADGQLAAYGMLDAQEVHRQREQLDLAFDLLSEPERRRAYDERHFSGVVDAPSAAAGAPAAADAARLVGAPPPSRHLRRGRRIYACPLAAECGADTAFDGPLLRRLRESAGASLDDFCDATKISRRYLKAIEADDFGLLPAPVYVRGFVSEYARLLGLSPKGVADAYLARMSRR